MQYVLTQTELEELKDSAKVERQLDEWKIRIITAMEDVLKKHGARVHPNEPTYSPLNLLIADLKTAIKTP